MVKYKQSDQFFLDLIEAKKLKVFREGVVVNAETNKAIGTKTPFIVRQDEEGNRYGIATYRLVWIAFNGIPPNDDLVVYRKDLSLGNKLDNLELKTVAQKNREVGAGKPFSSRPGSSNSQARFTDGQVISLRLEYRREPFSVRAKAKELNTSHPILLNALKGISYSYLPHAITEMSRKFAGSRKGQSRKGISMQNRAPRAVSQKPVKQPSKPVQKLAPVKPKEVKSAATKPVMSATEKQKRLEIIKSISHKMRKTGHDI